MSVSQVSSNSSNAVRDASFYATQNVSADSAVNQKATSQSSNSTSNQSELTSNPRLAAYFNQPQASTKPPAMYQALAYGSTTPKNPHLNTNTGKEMIAGTLTTSAQAKELAAKGVANGLVPAWQNEVKQAATKNGGLGSSEQGFLAWGKDGFVRYRNVGLTPEQNKQLAEMSLSMGIAVEDIVANNHKEASFSNPSVNRSVESFIGRYQTELGAFFQNPKDGVSFREGKHNYTLSIHEESGIPVSSYFQKARGFKGWVQRSMDVIAPVVSTLGLVLAPFTAGLSTVASAAINYGVKAYAYGKEALKDWKGAVGEALGGVTGGVSNVVAGLAENGVDWKNIGRAALQYGSTLIGGSSMSATSKAVANTAVTVADDYLQDGKIDARTAAMALAQNLPAMSDNKTIDTSIRNAIVMGGEAIETGSLSGQSLAAAVQPLIQQALPEKYQDLAKPEQLMQLGAMIDKGEISSYDIWVMLEPALQRADFKGKGEIIELGRILTAYESQRRSIN
jgi:hypothetical protein